MFDLAAGISRTNTDRPAIAFLRNRVRSTWVAYKSAHPERRAEAYQAHVSVQEQFERACLNVSRRRPAELGDR